VYRLRSRRGLKSGTLSELEELNLGGTRVTDAG